VQRLWVSLEQAQGVDWVLSEEASDGVSGGKTLMAPHELALVYTIRNEDDAACTRLVSTVIQEL